MLWLYVLLLPSESAVQLPGSYPALYQSPNRQMAKNRNPNSLLLYLLLPTRRRYTARTASQRGLQGHHRLLYHMPGHLAIHEIFLFLPGDQLSLKNAFDPDLYDHRHSSFYHAYVHIPTYRVSCLYYTVLGCST